MVDCDEPDGVARSLIIEYDSESQVLDQTLQGSLKAWSRIQTRIAAVHNGCRQRKEVPLDDGQSNRLAALDPHSTFVVLQVARYFPSNVDTLGAEYLWKKVERSGLAILEYQARMFARWQCNAS